ncbi:MAG TPA: heavy-metal-associated domain-containing protein [Ignavibacteriaceae bacterium]|nr:heavy-metal-associated domain-containing protein [Ignavibacteriaceae bacterium]
MKKKIKIEGMSCSHCIINIQKSLAKLKLKKIDVKMGSAEVEYDESKFDEKELIKAVEDAGYKVVDS